MNPTPQIPTSSSTTRQSSAAPMSRQALLETLIRFINHKFQIFNSRGGYHYKTNMAYLRNIEKTKDLRLWAQKEAPYRDPGAVCAHILINKQHLEGILPLRSNPSYNSQRQTLDLIMQSCQHGLQRK